jgi:hypothetical protein
MNKCDIARETADFLTEDTWCQEALVKDYNDGFNIEDEGEEFVWMRDHIGDEGYACCLVGSLIRALVKNGYTEWNVDTRDIYQSVGRELAATINETTGDDPPPEGSWGFGIVTEFNDTWSQDFQEVKDVANKFAERVCNASE